MSKAKLATMWLDGCSGCHMSFLDVDEGLISLAERVELVYSPLVDIPEYPHGVDIAIVEGAVSSEEDVEKIRQVRERTRILVALGDCAITTNVTGMRNPIPLKTIYERVYVEGSDAQKGIPSEGLPVHLKHAVPLHDVVKVDLHVPGCPPSAPVILYVLTELLDGRIPDLSARTRFG
jgi:NAD-reducing hydrogenase small subunit